MTKSFIFGLDSSIRNSAISETETLYKATGQNSGNLAFHFAIENMIQLDMPSTGWATSKENLAKISGTAVLPCANQVGSHANYGWLANKVNELQGSVIALGLGAQSGTSGTIPEVPQGTLDWINAITEKSSGDSANIGVRGEFTYKVLQHYGVSEKVEILGCPTLFINPDKDLGQKIEEKMKTFPQRVAVPGGHQKWAHLSRIEQCLASIVSETHGSYIGQSPFEMFQLTRSEVELLSPEAFTECKKYLMPYVTDKTFIDWCNRYGNLFFDIPAWMEHYRKFDFVVGPRIHGVILGLQTGIPSLCIVHDSRTLELCQTLKVPYVMAGDIIKGVSLAELWEKTNFNAEEFEENRTILAGKFCRFFENNNIKHSSFMDEMAGR